MKKNITLSLASTVFTLLAAVIFGEIYVRLFSPIGYETPEIRKIHSLQYIPSLFARHIFPQKEIRAKGWEGVNYYINEKGYRGHNFTINKPEQTTRIIFYGGSATFDPAAGEGEDWPHRIENLLKQEGFSNIEVINAGIPGHASWDSLGRFFSEGHEFNPDYVVFYNAWNDIKYFRSGKSLLRHYKPYNLDPRLNYQNAVDRSLSENFQLYVRLRDRYYFWKYNLGPEGQRPVEEYTATINQAQLKQYKLNVHMFVDLARNIDTIPILMTQGRLVTSNNTDEQKARIRYDYQLLTHQALNQAFEETDRIIREVAEEKNVYLIDASKYITGKDELFRDHVHLTPAGSNKLATVTAQEIEKLLRQRE